MPSSRETSSRSSPRKSWRTAAVLRGEEKRPRSPWFGVSVMVVGSWVWTRCCPNGMSNETQERRKANTAEAVQVAHAVQEQVAEKVVAQVIDTVQQQVTEAVQCAEAEHL